jgi:chorismate-pyruvate lyase
MRPRTPGGSMCESPGTRALNATCREQPVDARVIAFEPDDNVLVACASLPAGTFVEIEGVPLVLRTNIPLGHKIARRRIEAGEKVVKCGVRIGSATQAIVAGEHVHTHNLKSDYIPTLTRRNEPDSKEEGGR